MKPISEELQSKLTFLYEREGSYAKLAKALGYDDEDVVRMKPQLSAAVRGKGVSKRIADELLEAVDPVAAEEAKNAPSENPRPRINKEYIAQTPEGMTPNDFYGWAIKQWNRLDELEPPVDYTIPQVDGPVPHSPSVRAYMQYEEDNPIRDPEPGPGPGADRAYDKRQLPPKWVVVKWDNGEIVADWLTSWKGLPVILSWSDVIQMRDGEPFIVPFVTLFDKAGQHFPEDYTVDGTAFTVTHLTDLPPGMDPGWRLEIYPNPNAESVYAYEVLHPSVLAYACLHHGVSPQVTRASGQEILDNIRKGLLERIEKDTEAMASA